MRSWMQISMQIFSNDDSESEPDSDLQSLPESWRQGCLKVDGELARHHLVKGAGGDASSWVEKLVDIAVEYYGHAHMWRLIAEFNSLGNPQALQAGDVLRIPPLSEWERVGCAP